MAALDYVLDLMEFDSRFRGRKLERPEAICEGFSLERGL
jgi:hypothetical protein